MDSKVKKYVLPIIMAVYMLGMCIWCMVSPQKHYSESERRALAKRPELTWNAVVSGGYMQSFEAYSLDQFPMRDLFRSVKAVSERYVFHKKDNHQLYLADGVINKIEYPENEEMLDYAGDLFEDIYDSYLESRGIVPYLAIIPDKHYFYGEENHSLMMDYDAFEADMQERMPYAEYIDIRSELVKEDYYATDSHWKQNRILPVAGKLLREMNAEESDIEKSDIEKSDAEETDAVIAATDSYEEKTLDIPFYGVYYGQAALPVKPDTIQYLTNDELDACTVTILDEKGETKTTIYNPEKAKQKDAYDLFLSGAVPLVTIQNPLTSTERRLIIFRDSFASSLAPLLVPGYKEVVLIDLRYMSSTQLSEYVDFENADVLFLYSTTILNNSKSMK